MRLQQAFWGLYSPSSSNYLPSGRPPFGDLTKGFDLHSPASQELCSHGERWEFFVTPSRHQFQTRLFGWRSTDCRSVRHLLDCWPLHSPAPAANTSRFCCVSTRSSSVDWHQHGQRPWPVPDPRPSACSPAVTGTKCDFVDFSDQSRQRPIPDPFPKSVVLQTCVPAAARPTGVPAASSYCQQFTSCRTTAGIRDSSPASLKTPRRDFRLCLGFPVLLSLFLHDPHGVLETLSSLRGINQVKSSLFVCLFVCLFPFISVLSLLLTFFSRSSYLWHTINLGLLLSERHLSKQTEVLSWSVTVFLCSF